MKKIYIDKSGSLFLVHTGDYSIAIWCDNYEIKEIVEGNKYVSMTYGKHYLGTIDCDAVEVGF